MFKNLKIKMKLLISFIICVALASVAAIITLCMLSNTSGKYEYALKYYGFSSGDVGNAMATFYHLDGLVHDSVSFFDTQHAQEALKGVDSQATAVTSALTKVNETLTSTEDKACYAAISEAWKSYEPLAKELARIGSNTNDPTSTQNIQQRLVNELDPLYQTISDNLTSLMNNNISYGTTLSKDLQDSTNLAVVVGIALIVVSVIISLLLGILIANGISKPIRACSARLALLSEGNLSAPVPDIQSKDEVGVLADSTRIIVAGLTTVVEDVGYLLTEMGSGNFDVRTQQADVYKGDFAPMLANVRKINSSLSDVLSQIRQSAEQVSAGADQVSTGAQALAQGATEQASAVEELSATISDIANNARLNAQTAEEAQTHANAAGGQVNLSNEQMGQMSIAMSDISKSSQEIGKIIATIENIAFQTNILALNAAVEAARAGTAGKGFAVVADEVRNLASKSDQAAKATKELIENSIRAVENGSQLVNSVAESLRKTTELAVLAVGDMAKVALSVEGEAASINQVTEGIEQISAVVQTNSATSEESAAASEELSSQAALMRQLMARFKLRKQETGSYYEPSAAEAPPEASTTDHTYASSSKGNVFSKY